MKHPKFKQGDRWSALEVLRVESYTYVKHFMDKDGNPTGSTEEYPNSTKVVLRCDCGKEVEYDTDLIPGKRTLRDCGCGSGSLLTARGLMGKERGVIASLYIPRLMHAELTEYAWKNRLALNRAVINLLELSRPVWEQDVDSTPESKLEGKKGGK